MRVLLTVFGSVNALRQLRALQGGPAEGSASKEKAEGGAVPTNLQAMSVTDCCICKCWR
jgi:hypothetical protein